MALYYGKRILQLTIEVRREAQGNNDLLLDLDAVERRIDLLLPYDALPYGDSNELRLEWGTIEDGAGRFTPVGKTREEREASADAFLDWEG